jgi:hypothetical protein
MRSLLAVTVLGVAVAAGQQPATFAPDAEGFIRNWLVLAPIAIPEDSGASEIDREQIDAEAAVTPKAGEAINVGGKIVTWRTHQTPAYFIDFREAFGAERGEDAAGYAVAYVLAETEIRARLSIGSNDQCKVWLNGKPVVKFAETRTLEKDTDGGDVTLVKGRNVLVFKVINEKNSWQGAARFLQNGAPVTTIRISVDPK